MKTPEMPKTKGSKSASFDADHRAQVMIVDDHPLTREGLAALVNRQPDLEVCCQFSNPSEGLSHLQKQRPDILVTDLTLPGRGGMEMIKDVTTLYAGIPVLVLSMHDELMHAERVLRSGARGYVMQARKWCFRRSARCYPGKFLRVNKCRQESWISIPIRRNEQLDHPLKSFRTGSFRFLK